MKLKSFALSICAAVACVSCTKDVSLSLKEAEIIVEAGVTETRAGYEGTQVLPDMFIMDIVQNSDSRYDYKGVVMKKSGNVYSPESSDIKLLWAGTPYDEVHVKAMTIPSGMTGVDPDVSMSIGVNTDQSTEDGVLDSDVLVATKDNQDIIINKDKINIEFKHLFSKLEVKWALGNGLQPSDVIINSAVLENICMKGGFSYSTMSFDNNITKMMGSVSMLVNASENILEAIIFPYAPTVNPRLVVNATIRGVEKILACTIVPKSADGFAAGNRYMMIATVNSDDISISSVGISSGWDTNTEDTDFDTL